MFNFGYNHKRPEEITLNRGDCVLIAIWRWKKLGYDRKLVCLGNDGKVSVTKV